jgi:hypothetical protein
VKTLGEAILEANFSSNGGQSSVSDKTINLRCPKCGEMRYPVVASPYLPADAIVLLCDTCYRRSLRMPGWVKNTDKDREQAN